MKLQTRPWHFFIIAFIVIGCNSSEQLPLPTPMEMPDPRISPPPENLPTPTLSYVLDLAEILQISEIRSIELEDHWSGLNDYGPTASYYSLLPAGTEFVGQVNFRVGGDFMDPIAEIQDLQIPVENIQSFINKLAESPSIQGKYEPLIEWTDDYPSLSIDIKLQAESILFYTSSQGEYHKPWAIFFKDRTYIVNSTAPMDALNQLAPYLKKNRLRELEQEVLNNPYTNPSTPKGPTVTPRRR